MWFLLFLLAAGREPARPRLPTFNKSQTNMASSRQHAAGFWAISRRFLAG
tara:strand:+ start:3007 stop:3156 length:150 start_codon:yes stop_codon:yes gene_type:complete